MQYSNTIPLNSLLSSFVLSLLPLTSVLQFHIEHSIFLNGPAMAILLFPLLNFLFSFALTLICFYFLLIPEIMNLSRKKNEISK